MSTGTCIHVSTLMYIYTYIHIICTYIHIYRWDEAIAIAQSKNRPETEELKTSYFQWLLETSQVCLLETFTCVCVCVCVCVFEAFTCVCVCVYVC